MSARDDVAAAFREERGRVLATLIHLTGDQALAEECVSWGAIFLHDSRGASLGLAATAVTAYTAGQTGGRLVGDRLTLRYGASPVFRTGGLVAAGGLAMAVLTSQPAAAVAGSPSWASARRSCSR